MPGRTPLSGTRLNTLFRPPVGRLHYLPIGLSLAAGGIAVNAFAPHGLWPLQLLTLALLFFLIDIHQRPLQAFLCGWAYALGTLLLGVKWLVVSMHDYGGLPAPLAILALALLCASLATLYGFALAWAAWLATRLGSRAFTLLGLLPASWMLADWLRGWVFTGFPWLATGYAQTESPLGAFAPVVGVYGVGWLAGIVAGCLAMLVHQRRPLHRPALVLLALILGGGLLLQTVRWTTPQGAPVTVRLLQGNVAQEMKFAPEQLAASLALYRDLLTDTPADLIATPETALPLLPRYLPETYLQTLADFSQRSGSALLVGVPWTTAPGIYLNSVLGMRDGDAQAYRYDKHHLVPFGEFIPPGARWFVDLMNIPLGDFGRGDLVQPSFPVKDQWVLPNICYEDLFGEEIATQLSAAHDRGMPVASMLLNVSNIAWFGDTIALPQHLQISQMRARETGRPMLRATNTGVTAVIDPQGQVVSRLPVLTRGTLEAQVQGMQGLTPYVRLGNSPVVILALLLLGAALRKSRRTGKKG